MLKEHNCPHCNGIIFVDTCVTCDLEQYLDVPVCKFCGLPWLRKSMEDRRTHIHQCADNPDRKMYKKPGRPPKS